MTPEIAPEVLDQKLIISGIHLDLTDGMKQHVREKVSKLLRHEPHIVRVRVTIEYHQTKSNHGQFIADYASAPPTACRNATNPAPSTSTPSCQKSTERLRSTHPSPILLLTEQDFLDAEEGVRSCFLYL